MQALLLLIGMVLFTIIAYCDVRTRRIPNALAIAVAALGLFRMILAADAGAGLYTVGAAAAVFAAAFLLFWRGVLGGGDVKLMAAAALLVGYHDLLAFLFVMSICGALIALAVLTAYKFPLRRAAEPLLQTPPGPPARLTVPYGVAIAAAGIFTLLVQSFIPG